ncbi:MAG: cell division protein [Flammeovirgaceae bacterium]|nr:cell division protein [Flammeovirgaceae bacterium]|tara:strand:+ start:22048 stop:22944 length:897 start_codon:yes stop_codon:yes gene_type:complete
MFKKRKKIAKKTFGNFPFLSVIFSVSLSLLLLGIFSFFLLSSIEVKKIIQENTEINIFLNKEISSNQIDQIKRTLFTKDYVLIKDESTLDFISSSDAAREFSEEIGEDFVSFLGNNPLRDLIILKINSNFFEQEKLTEIENDILKIPGVYEVDYSKEMIEDINTNVRSISLVFGGIFIVLFLISVILINNTLRIALFSQRFLIRSMQLVGATANYILKPFLIRGIAYGLISGVIASAILYSIISLINEKINEANMIISFEKLSIIFISLIISGILIVMISTYTSVNKYLNSTLDDLYK